MPTARRINRGAQVLPDLVELCRSNDFTDLVVVHEHRGEQDGLVVSHMPFGPTAYFGLSNTVMRHDVKDQDIGTVSEANPHLVLENFTTPLGKRTANILKHLFPAPKDGKSKRVITFANTRTTSRCATTPTRCPAARNRWRSPRSDPGSR